MAREATYWLTGLVVFAVLVVAGLAFVSQESQAATPTPVADANPRPTKTTATPSTSALEAIDSAGRFSVSVVDIDTSQTLSYGDGSFDTASIVKVDILAALLWQHQQDGTSLTAYEKSLAAAMIKRSDNSAATTLFNAVGGKAGLEAFNELVGLTDTVVGSNGHWGLTQTTAADQIRLLKVVFGDSSVLTAASQSYEQELMANVVDHQNFGVSAAADDADEAALKVGYLQRSATGLWDVTSVGQIEAGGHTYLVAVLSDGNPTYEAGVALVERVARAAVGAFAESAI